MKSNARRPHRARLPELALGLAMIAALGSCSEPPARPAPAPAPPPVIAPAPTVPTAAPLLAWQDAPLTPGDWQWQRGVASYAGPSGTVVELRCDRRRAVVMLVWPGPASARSLMVETSTLSRPLSAAVAADGAALVAELPVNDPLLDAMAFSRGRFALEAAGRAPLVLPAWPEVARVIEDCR